MRAPAILWFTISLAVVLLFLLSIALGSEWIPPDTLFKVLGVAPKTLFKFLNGQIELSTDHTIIWKLRLPRSVMALMGGAALAVAGMLMQTLFRNPLAGPSVLGLSTGASLAVAIVTMAPMGILLKAWTIPVAAIIGSTAVLLIILAVAKRFADVASVLIVGLMLGFFASALVGFLQSAAGENALKAYIFWGFGTFSNVDLRSLWIPAVVILPILFLLPRLATSLNHLLLGELHARTMGVSVGRLRFEVIAATGLLTGIVTAYCGPVAFIGLAAPHLARFTFRTVQHRLVMPASALWGGGLALLCDLLARMPFANTTLPLNSVCALMGAPVVIYLIFAGRNKRLLL